MNSLRLTFIALGIMACARGEHDAAHDDTAPAIIDSVAFPAQPVTPPPPLATPSAPAAEPQPGRTGTPQPPAKRDTAVARDTGRRPSAVDSIIGWDSVIPIQPKGIPQR